MATKTLYNHSLVREALTQAARTNGTVSGTAVDTGVFNNNFRSVMFVVSTATITDGSHAFTVEECDTSGGTYTAMDAFRVLGSLPTIVSTDDDTFFSFSVRPTKRFVRVVATTSGATTGGVFSAKAILGNGSLNPVARS